MSRRWTILWSEIFTKGYVQPLKKYIGIANKDLLTVKEGEKYSLYNSLDSLKEISLALVGKLRKNKNFGLKFYRNCLATSENLVKTAKQVSRGRLNALSSSNLSERFNKFIAAAYNFIPFLALPPNYEIYITGKIKDFLTEKVGQSKIESYLQRLTTPKAYPFQVLEQIDLAKIALRTKEKRRVNLDKELNSHKEKYQWLSCYNYDEDPFSLDDFKKRLGSLSGLTLKELKEKVKDATEKLKRDELEFQRAVKETGLSGNLLNEVKLLREFVFLRTYRIEMNSQSNFYLKPLLAEIASNGKVSVGELSMMLSEEIKSMLKTGRVPKPVDFNERKKAMAMWLENCKFNYAFGNEAKKIISKQSLTLTVDASVNEVKGTIASSQGVVRGKARIVDRTNISNFLKGEVLITVMTSPEFVPAIQKSVAIVTDEGGVLCHAAIVSREMKKPCIIGTQIATKVFKDGDLVEVDTIKGVVRKIP